MFAFTNPVLRWGQYVLLLGALVAFPFIADAYWTDVAVFFGIYVILGLSLNLILGEVGLFNMGHAAFFGIGAHLTAILSIQFVTGVIWLLPRAAIGAGLVGGILTAPLSHLRGEYVVIGTIGIDETASGAP